MIGIAAKPLVDTVAATSGSALVFGLTIGEVNEYLRAVSLLVGIVGVICASVYYITMTLKARRERGPK